MQAVGKNLILKEVEEEKVNKKGSLILPSEKKEKFYEVVSVGEEVKNIEIGDVVFPLHYNVTHHSYNNENFHLCNADSVYLKL